jgi:hypothetical protein
VIRKIEVVKSMLNSILYSHERSQAILRRELKKLQALRDKLRANIKKLVEREFTRFEKIMLASSKE